MVGAVVVVVLFVGNLIGFLLLAHAAAGYVTAGYALYAIGAYFAVVAQAIVVAAGFSEAVRRFRDD
jgi:hypothetical protein